MKANTHSLDRLTGDRSLLPLHSHWPYPKPHLQQARHRPPAGGSKFVGDNLVDVCLPVYLQVGDLQTKCFMRIGTAGPYRRRICPNIEIRTVRRGFCCRRFAAESVSSLTRLAQSRTSVFQESIASKTSVKPRVSVVGVGRRRQKRRSTITTWCRNFLES